MSDLSNLYISQSFYGVVNLVDSTQPFVSQSQSVIQFQDGVGESLGISVTDVKDFIFDNNVVVSQSLQVLGIISGSSARLNGDLFVSGTINASKVITLIESSSIIYSSGSNILGDEIIDIQTIVGQTSISGSLTVIGNHTHTGNLSLTGSLFVSNEISSSTIAGIGNVTLYSQSVDSRLDTLEGKTSNLESFTSSQESKNSTLSAYTSSNDTKWNTLQYVTSSLLIFTGSTNQRLNSLEVFTASLAANFVTDLEYSASIAVVTGSLINSINTKLDTGSYLIDSSSFNTRINTKLENSWTSSVFSPFSSSVDTRINTKLDSSWTSSVFSPFSSSVDSRIATNASNLTSVSASIAITDSNQQSQIQSLISFTGSYATTGSNTFIGNQVFSGSVQGNVYEVSLSSLTASIDCSLGNFFTFNAGSDNTFLLRATNISGGRTITLKINKTASGAVINVDTGSIKMPNGFLYSATLGTNVEDVLTFVTFDTGSLYGVSSKNFV
jgi:hypothetical protein